MDITRTNATVKSTFLEKGLATLKASTIETYRTIYKRCIRRALRLRELNPDEPAIIIPMDLVDDWHANLGNNRPKTANIERSALLWVLQHDKPEGWEAAHTHLSSLRQEPVSSRAAGGDYLDKRSRTPGRMIPEEDLKILGNTLANMDLWGARSQWFLLAGVASGARPIEWPDAEWAPGSEETVLRIFTAKVKNRNAWNKIPAMTFTAEDTEHETDQAFDERAARGQDSPSWYEVDFNRRLASLDLTNEECTELDGARFKNGVKLFRDVFIEPQYRTYVRMHIESVKQVIETTQKDPGYQDEPDLSTEAVFRKYYYNQLRHCIWRACKKAFPDGRLYSLADTRSTFSANRKALNGLESAAKDLGHAGITTARDYYAPARKSWTKYRQKPESAQKEGNVEAQVDPAKPSPRTP